MDPVAQQPEVLVNMHPFPNLDAEANMLRMWTAWADGSSTRTRNTAFRTDDIRRRDLVHAVR